MENANKKTGPERDAPPNTPHDKLFKVVFKRTHYVRELLNARLPAKLLARLDLDTLRLSDTGRVNSSLNEDFTDIQLVCDTTEGNPVELPFILEHKSYIPQYPPLQ